MRGVLFLLFFVTILVSADEARVQRLLKQLTLEQKVSLCHGTGGSIGNQNYVGTINGIPSLSIPPLTMEDGPQGVADGVRQTTDWPSALTMSQTFDTDLFAKYAAAAAEEQALRGTVRVFFSCCSRSVSQWVCSYRA